MLGLQIYLTIIIVMFVALCWVWLGKLGILMAEEQRNRFGMDMDLIRFESEGFDCVLGPLVILLVLINYLLEIVFIAIVRARNRNIEIQSDRAKKRQASKKPRQWDEDGNVDRR